MSEMTLAGQLIDVLRQAEVERGYGVVGDSLNPVLDVRAGSCGPGGVGRMLDLARTNLRNIPRPIV